MPPEASPSRWLYQRSYIYAASRAHEDTASYALSLRLRLAALAERQGPPPLYHRLRLCRISIPTLALMVPARDAGAAIITADDAIGSAASSHFKRT